VTISNSEATGTTGTLTSQTDTPAMTSGEATSMQTGTPGLNGHQSSDPSTDPSGTATAQSQSTTDPTASPTSYKNSSGRLEASLSAMLLAVLAYGTLI
jgi:flagellar basal body L-ring protein FlgH